MKISNRLKIISTLVENNTNVIDVGCDHALLDIYLYQNKKNIKIIASDINKKPLEGAKENIKKYNLEDKIETSLASGIEKMPDFIDTIIISGMGTTNILNILFKDKEKLKNIKNIIISSNNDYYLLRKTITKNNYYIKEEKIVKENNKFYPIILFEKGNKKYSNFKLKYGPILLSENSKEFKEYMKLETDKLNKIVKNLSNKYFLKKLRIKLEIKRIKNVTKKLTNN